MHRLLLLLVTLFFISCEQEWTSVAPRHKKYFATMPEPEKPRRWLNFTYDKVTVHIAAEKSGLSIMDGKPSGKMLTRQLNHFEVVQLDNLLSSNEKDSIRRPAAFMPLHAIFFWNKDEIVAHVQICYIGTTNTSPRTEHHHFENYRRLFESYGYPIFYSMDEHFAHYEKLYKKLHPER